MRWIGGVGSGVVGFEDEGADEETNELIVCAGWVGFGLKLYSFIHSHLLRIGQN